MCFDPMLFVMNVKLIAPIQFSLAAKKIHPAVVILHLCDVILKLLFVADSFGTVLSALNK